MESTGNDTIPLVDRLTKELQDLRNELKREEEERKQNEREVSMEDLAFHFQLAYIREPTKAIVQGISATEHDHARIIDVAKEITEYHIYCALYAPQGSEYERGEPYHVRLEFSDEYPTLPSRITFLSIIYHNAIDQESGMTIPLNTTHGPVDLIECLAIISQFFRGPLHPCDDCNKKFAVLSSTFKSRNQTIEKFRKLQPTECMLLDPNVQQPWKLRDFHPKLVEAMDWDSEASLMKAITPKVEKNLKELFRLEIGRPEDSAKDKVFSFPMFSDGFCSEFLNVLERFDESGLPASRPNSMNNYGLIVNDIGMERAFSTLQKILLQPISSALFGHLSASFKSLERHHSFVVRYEVGQDTGLDMHEDSSDVTFNVSLNSNFKGGDLAFCGVRGESNHRHHSGNYAHQFGRCVVHLGTKRHAALNITEGQRSNLIIWNTSATAARLGLNRPKSRTADGTAPALICLSRTHDEDYAKHHATRKNV